MTKKLLVHRQPWLPVFEFLYVEERPGGQFFRASSMNMEPDEPDNFVTAPSFSLHPEQAQALMDQLWTCGLRPSEGSGSAGSLAATERHLEDMRKLAMHWCLRDEPGPPRP